MRLMVNFVYPPVCVGQGTGVVVVAGVVIVDFATSMNDMVNVLCNEPKM